MNDPRKFYETLVSSIEEQEVRKVARILYYHIGKENRIEFKQLVVAAFLKYTVATERKTRLIINELVVKYRYPVCSLSATPGRWMAANKDEALESAREIENRIQELNFRATALRLIDLPVVPLEDKERKAQVSFF